MTAQPAVVAPPASSNAPAWLVPVGVSTWAVVSGYLGLLTFVFCGIPGPFAVWTGVMGLGRIERDPALRGRVRCWTGIVLGGLGSVLLVFLGLALAAGD